jgi:hypothetical protein
MGITDANGGDRHYSVPDPDDPDAGRTDPGQADLDPRDQEIARLRAELGKRDQAGPEPVTVAEQKAAGVPDDQTVTVAEQKAGTPAPEPANGKHATKG